MPEAHPRVLHVEDNDFFARVTAEILDEEYGIDVCRVGNADAALDRLEAERFDCIVSDYEMPGMDGLELLDAVRETDPDVPFILLTGGGSEKIASRAISAGVTDYLRKTDGKEQFAVLANRIENAISRRRAERRADRQIAVNDLIWDVSQVVLRATSRDDIERRVCDRLADSGPYVLAWVGTVDAETRAVRPEAAAGVEQRHLDAVVLEVEREADEPLPAQRAVEERAVQVVRGPELERRFDVEFELPAERFTLAAIPLVYEDRSYGVLSVWSDARHAFDETERRVLAKFGTTLAYAIESVQTRKELVRREQRLQVFNRILRHNLRNDLNVVLGRAENIAEEHPEAACEADLIRQKAGELIEISEKAREVGETLDREDTTTRRVDVADCVERTCEKFRQAYPDTEIATDVPDGAAVYADKTLDAAISEVVENAIEHGGEDPSVTVAVSAPDEEWVEVTVLDDGPGIPEEEREVLTEGEETALHHGSGLGLWLSNWIVGKFGGELAFDDYRTEGTAVTLRLQRTLGDGSQRDDGPERRANAE